MDSLTGMDQLFTRLQSALTGGAATNDVTEATTDDGFVVAAVARGGELVSLEGDARLLRRTPEEIGAAIVEAVNRARDANAATPTGPDLMSELAAVRDESATLMKQTTVELTDAIKRMERMFE